MNLPTIVISIQSRCTAKTQNESGDFQFAVTTISYLKIRLEDPPSGNTCVSQLPDDRGNCNATDANVMIGGEVKFYVIRI